MKIYFAGSYTHLAVKWGVKNILDSYWYLRSDKEKTKLLIEKSESLFIDSGAFSAANIQANIKIDEYINFLKKWNIKMYAGLDVIGNPEATKENIKYMEEKGFNPIPTYHLGSDIKYLQEMLGADYNYIALGGMVRMDLSTKVRMDWLDRTFKEIRNRRDDIKIHGFGVTSIPVMRAYPWASVDSTAWIAPLRFGKMPDGKHYDDIVDEHMKETKEGIIGIKKLETEVILKKTIKHFLDLETEINIHHKNYDFNRLDQMYLF